MTPMTAFEVARAMAVMTGKPVMTIEVDSPCAPGDRFKDGMHGLPGESRGILENGDIAFLAFDTDGEANDAMDRLEGESTEPTRTTLGITARIEYPSGVVRLFQESRMGWRITIPTTWECEAQPSHPGDTPTDEDASRHSIQTCPKVTDGSRAGRAGQRDDDHGRDGTDRTIGGRTR